MPRDKTPAGAERFMLHMTFMPCVCAVFVHVYDCGLPLLCTVKADTGVWSLSKCSVNIISFIIITICLMLVLETCHERPSKVNINVIFFNCWTQLSCMCIALCRQCMRTDFLACVLLMTSINFTTTSAPHIVLFCLERARATARGFVLLLTYISHTHIESC